MTPVVTGDTNIIGMASSEHDFTGDVMMMWRTLAGYHGRNDNSDVDAWLTTGAGDTTAVAAPSRHLDMATKQIGMQEPFLANTTNKKGFIVLLKQYLEQQGTTVCQAAGDADTLIVSTELKIAVEGSRIVVMVSEDTDILVLLLYHWQATIQNVSVLHV